MIRYYVSLDLLSQRESVGSFHLVCMWMAHVVMVSFSESEYLGHNFDIELVQVASNGDENDNLILPCYFKDSKNFGRFYTKV